MSLPKTTGEEVEPAIAGWDLESVFLSDEEEENLNNKVKNLKQSSFYRQPRRLRLRLHQTRRLRLPLHRQRQSNLV
ncbi:hypothetical protein IGI04_033404 [Brassica rapa subsp. trilocularis]|uniref:Uncharacterized protein n=1 Tax=Brassica rapa subsp. trilocularis TaxID=1813537 RepID=A0ABQ7L5R3_BRACM|nr:hypothetical protein IGI04_033404 [Brassica rapa subsp. trilocularis]